MKNKQKNKETIFNLTVQDLEKVQNNNWPPGAGIEWTGKKSHWPEKGEEVGDGRSTAPGGGGQAVMSLTPDVDGSGSGSLLEPDAQSHLWKFTTWRFVYRGVTVPFSTLSSKHRAPSGDQHYFHNKTLINHQGETWQRNLASLGLFAI